MKKTTKTLIIAIVSVVLLVGVSLLVYFLVPDKSNGDDTPTTPLSENTDTDETQTEDHYHLVSHIPAEIKSMDVENETGKYTILSETPKTETTASDGTVSFLTDATVYTLVGYENMELLTGSPARSTRREKQPLLSAARCLMTLHAFRMRTRFS